MASRAFGRDGRHRGYIRVLVCSDHLAVPSQESPAAALRSVQAGPGTPRSSTPATLRYDHDNPLDGGLGVPWRVWHAWLSLADNRDVDELEKR